MMDILWLGEPDCHVASSVGGKAANLSRLALAYPVPPGFCLPVSVWQRACLARQSRDHEADGLPEALREAVAEAYAELASRRGDPAPAVAVRSSAVDEDGALASFAGQNETYLNVIGAEAVGQAIARCWASSRSERVVAYRRQHGLQTEGVGVAVLVQQLVSADISAVIFSANSISGNRDEVMITASYGLGESIVSGTVTPDTYLVDKNTLALVRRDLGEKAHMTIRTPDGAREVATPRLLRGQFVLSEAQVSEAARLAAMLEETMGWPADIECAWQGGRLHLLQCRPITTLSTSAVA